MNHIIGQNIFVINKYFKMYFKNALKPYHLNTAEALVLLTLYDQLEITNAHLPAGFTQDKILSELHYHKSVLTRTMQSLESREFVLRGEHPSDNRCHLFTLTNKALEFMPTLIHILKVWNMTLLHDVKNQKMVEEAITQMMDNVFQLVKGGTSNEGNKEK